VRKATPPDQSTRPGAPEPLGSPAPTRPLLEYVTSAGCRDCRAFEALIARVLPDFPTVEARPVPGDSERGIALSIGRGLLRFPVIVLDDEVLAIEAIDESDLRAALVHRSGASS
jgi:hypothetical protein